MMPWFSRSESSGLRRSDQAVCRRPSQISALPVLLDPDDRFEQDGEDLLAVDPGQGQGDLGLDDAEFDAEVVPRPAGLEGQVLLAHGPGRSAPW